MAFRHRNRKKIQFEDIFNDILHVCIIPSHYFLFCFQYIAIFMIIITFYNIIAAEKCKKSHIILCIS